MKGFERELEQAGFSGFLTKPIDVDALLGDLAKRLNGKPVEAPIVDMQVDPQHEQSPVEIDVAATESSAIVSRLAAHPKLGRIVARFVDQLSVKLTQMDSAIERVDMAELAALAHWLKGAGGSMGFDDLFDPAKALEDAAISGDRSLATSILYQLHDMERRILRGMPAPSPELAEAGA
jgi:HPt (histidine-containing phosphotransfer) domain-containing protein